MLNESFVQIYIGALAQFLHTFVGRSTVLSHVPYRTDPWLRSSRPPTRPPQQPRANQRAVMGRQGPPLIRVTGRITGGVGAGPPR